jgi:hypothetical protein
MALCHQEVVSNFNWGKAWMQRYEFKYNYCLFLLDEVVTVHMVCMEWTEFYTRCAWAGGTFFPVVLLCQFFGFGEK